MSTTTLFALFLVCAFSLYPSSTTAQPIVDSDGRPVVNGAQYYVIPSVLSLGGDLGLAQTGNETCPISVVQVPFQILNGLPLKISSPIKTLFIEEGYRLDLSFTKLPTCATTPSAWTVVKGLSEKPLVKVTGYDNTLNGAFVIQKASSKIPFQNSYKFQFCQFDSDECSNIGIVKDDSTNGIRLLGVTSKDDPALEFVLVRARRSSSSA